jgi:hypothetical protein
MRIPPIEAQAIYNQMLKDDRVRCTCDDVLRDESFFQANGHYHQCMLYQVTRAIELSWRYFVKDPTLMVQLSPVTAEKSNKVKQE